MKAIILAAGLGKRLRRITDKPKCLLRFKGLSLIQRCILFLKDSGLEDVAVVVGYKKDSVIKEINKFRNLVKIKVINNPEFSKGSILSLWSARSQFSQDTLLIDGDVFFEPGVIKKITESKKKNFFLIDTTAKNDSEAVMVGFMDNRAVALARGLKGRYDIRGEWAGFLRLSAATSKRLKDIIEHKVARGERDIGYEFVIPALFKNNRISYELIDGFEWVEIDFPDDIKKLEGLN